jgi:hypothetical protein
MNSYLNYVWIFIWTMYFKVFELCMDFYLKHVLTMYFKMLELCMDFYLKYIF